MVYDFGQAALKEITDVLANNSADQLGGSQGAGVCAFRHVKANPSRDKDFGAGLVKEEDAQPPAIAPSPTSATSSASNKAKSRPGHGNSFECINKDDDEAAVACQARSFASALIRSTRPQHKPIPFGSMSAQLRNVRLDGTQPRRWAVAQRSAAASTAARAATPAAQREWW
jgi:hypothetical protein